MSKQKLVKLLSPVLVLAAGTAVAALFLMNPNEAGKRPRPESQAILVEAATIETGDHTIKGKRWARSCRRCRSN